MRRGSLTLVTRPSTVDPKGISVLPLTTTGLVTFPWKGSPTRLLKVARVVSSRTIRAVPAGTGEPVWAASVAAKSRMQGRAIHFFIVPPQTSRALLYLLTLVQGRGGDPMRAGQGTSGDKGAVDGGRTDGSKGGNRRRRVCLKSQCVHRHSI